MIYQTRAGLTVLETLIAIGVATLGVFGAFAMLPVASLQTQMGLIEDHKSFLGQNAFNEFELRGMGHSGNWVHPAATPLAVNTPYCIDPLYVAGGVGVNKFPAVGALQMDRITLKADPNLPAAMASLMAEQVFVSSDDLVFHGTDDVLLPPEQEYTTNATKRQAKGEYSWMATIVPKFLDPGLGPLGQTDLYTLSIVVYYNRVAEAERVATVVASGDFYGGGVGGGDMMITGATADDVAVNQRDWVMLSQSFTISGTPVIIHKWYRVVAVDVDETDTLPTRDITLQGPDIATVAGTQVTIAKGVVAVYEKTIRLESSSLWIP